MIEVLAAVCLVFAAIPAGLATINLLLYWPLPEAMLTVRPGISVMIPARNEAARIGPVLEALRLNDYPEAEIIIGNDGSSDATAEIVTQQITRDPRIRLIDIQPLAGDGWAGKNRACFQLAQDAQHDLLIFLDADVVVGATALSSIAGHFERNPDCALLSGFPRQITETFSEKLLIPLIHFLLLGFLPFVGVRFTRHPMFGTACGQLIAARRAAYFATGGHSAFKSLLHDGLHLPRLFRKAGFRTDLEDFTLLARTRMYDNAADVQAGLTKNAHEAMATPVGLPVWTILLFFGQILPLPLLLLLWLLDAGTYAIALAALAVVLGIGLRAILAIRFLQPWLGVMTHPLGVAMLLKLQWSALLNRRSGGKVEWKGRQY